MSCLLSQAPPTTYRRWKELGHERQDFTSIGHSLGSGSEWKRRWMRMGRRGCLHKCFGGRGTPARLTPRVSMCGPPKPRKGKRDRGWPRRGCVQSRDPTPRSLPLRGAEARQERSQDSDLELPPPVTEVPGLLSKKPRFRVGSLETYRRLFSILGKAGLQVQPQPSEEGSQKDGKIGGTSDTPPPPRHVHTKSQASPRH